MTNSPDLNLKLSGLTQEKENVEVSSDVLSKLPVGSIRYFLFAIYIPMINLVL